MTKQTNTIETFILTLSESQKLYNIRNKQKRIRKSKLYKQLTKSKPMPKRIKPPLFYDSPSVEGTSR